MKEELPVAEEMDSSNVVMLGWSGSLIFAAYLDTECCSRNKNTQQ